MRISRRFAGRGAVRALAHDLLKQSLRLNLIPGPESGCFRLLLVAADPTPHLRINRRHITTMARFDFRDSPSKASLALLVALVGGCAAAGPGEAEWPPLAKKWFDRADASFKSGDVEDAETAV